jgi:hypothetical protein
MKFEKLPKESEVRDYVTQDLISFKHVRNMNSGMTKNIFCKLLYKKFLYG